MNEQQIIQELESAAQFITAPPNTISDQQRRSVENVFLNFRKSEVPYTLCRQILETSRNHYVLFEASEVLKSAIIREWPFLQESDTQSLRQYLMQYVFMRDDLPYFVQEKLLQIIAIMIKRFSVDDYGAGLSNNLTEIENIILQREPPKKILACSLIYHLLQEYCSTVKSTDVGLPWEVHFKAKKQFELTDLRRIFKFCIQLLSEICKNDPPYNADLLKLMENLLMISSTILTWGFVSLMLPKRLIAVYESIYEADQASSLRLTGSWSEVIFAPQFLPLMCEIYCKVRDYEILLHHILTCFTQLASLNGGIISVQEGQHQYITYFMENFLKLLELIGLNFKNNEGLGISNVIRKLQLFFGQEIIQLDPIIQETYLNCLSNITCYFGERARFEEAEQFEDQMYLEAYENMLEAWVNIFNEQDKTSAVIHRSATQIFNSYLKCHLAPPDGIRSSDDAKDIEENEDNDRIKYKQQLQVIGICGRIIPDYAFRQLFKLLEDRCDKLKRHLQIMQSQTMTLNDAANLDILFEDIHWIILVAGHMLCMESDGETPSIPSEIIHFSINQCNSGEINVNSTLKALADIPQLLFDISATQNCDFAIRIFVDVLKLCAIESSAAEVKLGHFMSPEVGCTLMWFLKRWCLSYLFPPEDFYESISLTISSALGKDTDCAKYVSNLILQKIRANICHFQSEPVLLQDTADLFMEITGYRQKAMYIIKSEGLWNLIRLQETLKNNTLPLNIHRCLYKGFTSCSSALTNNDELVQYFQQTLQPLKVRFDNIICRENFAQICQQDQVKLEIMDVLECFMGVSKGAQLSTTKLIFEYIAPILSELPTILKLYTNDETMVQLLLELFSECTKHMLYYLNQEDSKKLYESSLAAIEVYSKYNLNRFSGHIFAEEESFHDLLIVLKLLTHLLPKDCFDFGILDNEVQESSISAGDVALFGLNFVLPLMTMELLRYPSLCTQYYKLIVLINDIHSDKIEQLPEPMLNQLLKSIEIGLTAGFGTNIVQSCLDFVHMLAVHIFRNGHKSSKLYEFLRPFLKLILNLVLSHEIGSELMSIASIAIYALICCYSEDYQVLVQTLIRSQTNSVVANRLVSEFQALTRNVSLNCERHPKLKFRDNFDKFIANVHGFLTVK